MDAEAGRSEVRVMLYRPSLRTAWDTWYPTHAHACMHTHMHTKKGEEEEEKGEGNFCDSGQNRYFISKIIESHPQIYWQIGPLT